MNRRVPLWQMIKESKRVHSDQSGDASDVTEDSALNQDQAQINEAGKLALP